MLVSPASKELRTENETEVIQTQEAECEVEAKWDWDGTEIPWTPRLRS